jgi:hypothetical protein
LAFAALAARADPGVGEEQAAASSRGSLELNLRYRYESVDEDGFDSTAKASLLRTRVTAESGELGPLTGLLEIDDVTSVGIDHYNSTENGKIGYPTIADPEGTEVNQAWLRYRRQDLDATLGRQRIVLDRGRFVGAKPWRQNEQTYDGVRLQWNSGPDFTVDLSLVNQVNRAFGPRDGSNPGDWHGDSAFLRLSHKTDTGHELAGFAYRLDVHAQSDFDAGKTINNSSNTVGVAYGGTLSGVELLARIALQTDTGQSESDYRAPYYVLELAAPLGALNIRTAYEVLAADNGVGFSTPLANGHAYQGWADKFLATPGDGLQDVWLSLEGNVGPVALMARYHDFRAESSGTGFGSELDLQARWVVNEWLTATAKAAVFDSASSERYPDTHKVWLMFEIWL